MTEVEKAARAQIQAHEAAVSAPEAVQYRANSVDAFTELGPTEATDLFLNKFQQELAGLTADPARALRKAEEVIAYQDPNTAVIDPAGPEDRALHVSTMPLRTESGELPDLDLGRQQDVVIPDEPLTDIELPDELSAGIELEEINLTVDVEGAAPEDPDSRLVSTSGAETDRETAFYPEALTDTDIAVAARPRGVETFAQLRSAESPEELRFALDLPPGALIKDDGGAGEVVITDGAGEPLALVQAPMAVDAQGTSVPVTMEVQGHELVLRAPHKNAGFAYPILVDPVIEYWNWFIGGGTGALFDGTWSVLSNWLGPYEVSPYCNGYLAYSCNGTGWGLHVRAQSGYGYPAGTYGYWVYTAPGTTSYIETAYVYYLHYSRGGSSGYHPYAVAGLAGPYGWASVWTAVNDWWSGNTFLGNSGARYFEVGLFAGEYNVPTWPWRYVRIAEMGMNITDPESPTLNSIGGVPSGWLNGSENPSMTVNASDPGLGVQQVFLSHNGGPQNWYMNLPYCGGTRATTLCPANTATQPIYWDPTSLRQGFSKLRLSARDPIGAIATSEAVGHITTYEWDVKVDRTAPLIDLSDQLAQVTNEDGAAEPPEANPGSEPSDELSLPTYKLGITAQDGVANPTHDLHQRSGVKSIDLYLDDQEQRVAVPWGSPLCDPSNCTVSKTFELKLPDLSAGPHTLSVVVTDNAGNTSQRRVEFEYRPKTGIQDEYVMQYVDLEDGHQPAEGEMPPEPELAVNVANGNLVYQTKDVEVEGEDVDLELDRVYNSQLPEEQNTEWGDGWTIGQTPEITPHSAFTAGAVRTFEGWAKRDTDNTRDTLISGTSSDAGAPYLMLGGENGLPSNSVYWSPAGGYGLGATWNSAWPTPGTNTWVHWALVVNDTANTAELFVNGQSKGKRSVTTAYTSKPGALSVGAWRANDGSSYGFDGKLDEVAVYDRVLTPTQIRAHYGPGRYAQVVQSDRPAAYWRLGDDTDAAAADSSGNTNQGSYVGLPALNAAGAPAGSDDGDGAIDLNGSNQLVATTYSPFVNGTARTFEGWANRDAYNTYYMLLAGKSPDQSSPYMHVYGNDVYWAPNGNANYWSGTSWQNAWPGAAQWVHWALVFDEANDRAELFINGQSKGVKTLATPYPSSPGELHIGAWAADGSYYGFFDGKLDEIAVYDRALSPAEINRHLGQGAYAHLVGQQDPAIWWRLGEDTGTLAADSSGHSRTGAYEGSPGLNVTGALSAGNDDGSVDLNANTQFVATSPPSPDRAPPDPVDLTGPTGETNDELPVAEAGDETFQATPQATLTQQTDGDYKLAYETTEETFVLDEGGQTAQVNSYNDSSVAYARDSQGLLDQIATNEQDPAAETAADVATNNGLVNGVSGTEAGTHIYGHQGDDLTAHTSEQGSTNYEYYSDGNLKKITLPNGTTAEICYTPPGAPCETDPLGRVTKVIHDPAGEVGPQNTVIAYEDDPRRTTVTEPNGRVTKYDLQADGSVLHTRSGGDPPLIDDLGGSIYANYEAGTTLAVDDHNLLITATSPQEIASLRVLKDGNEQLYEKKCVVETSNCGSVTGEWVTSSGAHAPGVLNLEVLATDAYGNTTSERFSVTVPYTPPPPPDEPVPPSFQSVKNFVRLTASTLTSIPSRMSL